MTIKLNKKSIQEWERWLKNELEPPLVADMQTRYVLEAFLEAIELLKKKEPITV